MNMLPSNDLSNIPPPSSRRIAIRVIPAAEREIRKGHPWVFDNSIRKISHLGQPGDLAVVFNQKREFLAIGLYDPFSPIRLRILQYQHPAIINQDFFRSRLQTAKEIRKIIPINTTGYRLVHGENDYLPGLVIDQYDRTLVIKLYTLSWVPHLNEVIKALQELHDFERIILRLSRKIISPANSLFGLKDGIIIQGVQIEGPIMFFENGLRFETNPISGHKTGFYLDQRDNRKRSEELALGKTVLNLFAYSGGFSVYTARGGAIKVTSVDINRHALDVCKRNFIHNIDHPSVRRCQHETITGDAFHLLERLINQGRKFDMIIIDPPSFAKSKQETHKAIIAYKRLTRLSLKTLNTQGILIQASCSSHVKSEDFYKAVHQAARNMDHPLQDIFFSGHPVDHPIGFKQGSYLKCLFASR